MADSSEPKKEPVRIHLPTRPPSNPPDQPSPVRTAAAAMLAQMTIHSPKKEPARITILPNPPAKTAVEMKKTQPLINLPVVEAPATRVPIAPKIEPQPVSKIDEIPIPLCWGLLGVSAAILILQIWNYLW
jgi:hypothetical protein